MHDTWSFQRGGVECHNLYYFWRGLLRFRSNSNANSGPSAICCPRLLEAGYLRIHRLSIVNCELTGTNGIGSRFYWLAIVEMKWSHLLDLFFVSLAAAAGWEAVAENMADNKLRADHRAHTILMPNAIRADGSCQNKHVPHAKLNWVQWAAASSCQRRGRSGLPLTYWI